MKKNLLYLMMIIPLILVTNSCDKEFTVEPEYEISAYPWEFALPGDLGLNDSLIVNGFHETINIGNIYAVVIIRNGKVGATFYTSGTTSTSIYDIKSATKSYMSAFIGIAIQKGILSLDTKITDYFPTAKAGAQDPRVNDITVRHLLTMTSGLQKDDIIFPDISVSGWVDRILHYPLDNDPGTTYRYSDSGVYLLSALLTKAAGKNTFEFAKENFFTPLNFSVQGWYYNLDGVPIGGSTMQFTPKNMAVIGQLYLNKGKLNGVQILPESWINASLTNYRNWQNEEIGAMKKLGYGYLWWLGEMNGHKVFSAIGYGGQFVFCVPDYNMVIAVNCNPDLNWEKAGEQEVKILNLISKYFLPAVTN